jgi:protein-disulfide isomerase
MTMDTPSGATRRASKALVNFATAALWIGAAGLLFMAFYPRTRPAPVERVAISPDQWQEASASGHVIGGRDAAVEVIEFIDFECSYCEAGARSLDSLRQRYPALALKVRHFPLTNVHPQAYAEANAAECAGEQGRFEEIRRLLLATSGDRDSASWRRLGERAGVPDLAAFQKCLSADAYRELILRDIKAGQAVGVRSTPTYIVKDELLRGAGEVRRIEERLRSRTAPAARGDATPTPPAGSPSG